MKIYQDLTLQFFVQEEHLLKQSKTEFHRGDHFQGSLRILLYSTMEGLTTAWTGILMWSRGILPMALRSGVQLWPKSKGFQRGKFLSINLLLFLGFILGTAVKKNSGFAGVWGESEEKNRLTNQMYQFIMGLHKGPDFNLIQTQAAFHEDGVDEKHESNPPEDKDRPQWTRSGDDFSGRFMLNVDMALYHDIEGKQTGWVEGKFCSQWNSNNTLHDCSKEDPSFLPLSDNARQTWNYARNQMLYYWDIINAFISLTSVPFEFDQDEYREITSAWVGVYEKR